jgi:predicted nucleic acid-binding protein
VHSASQLLQTATESATNHHFLKDELPVSVISSRWSNRLGHKQITDAYLLALAIHHKAKLVTFDRRMETLAAEGSIERSALMILRP